MTQAIRKPLRMALGPAAAVSGGLALVGCAADGPRAELTPATSDLAWSDRSPWVENPALLAPPTVRPDSPRARLERERRRLIARQQEFARAQAVAQQRGLPAASPPTRNRTLDQPAPPQRPPGNAQWLGGNPHGPIHDTPQPATQPSP